MFTCIMCLGEFSDDHRSKEHIFPDSLGGTLTTWDLCVPCNSHLGSKVDSPLINNWLMRSIRHELGIAGKSGTVPHFMEGLDLTDEEGHKLQFRSNGGKWRLHTIPAVVSVQETDGEAELHIVLDESEESKAPGMLRKIIERRRAQGKPSKLVHQEQRRVTIHKPKIKAAFRFNMLGWKRGLLKIAYELTYLVCGESYLKDPVAVVYRDVLGRDEITQEYFESVRIRGQLDFRSEIALEFPLSELGKGDHLTAAVINTGDRLSVYVNIFDIFAAIVCTSEQPERYELPKSGQVYEIDVRHRASWVSSLEEWVAKRLRSQALKTNA